jgi:hypothetical protein
LTSVRFPRHADLVLPVAPFFLLMMMDVPERRDCQGTVLEPCESGWTGPMCDIKCQAGQPCDYSLYCHSWGATYGLSVAGTYLFDLDPAWPSWLLTAHLYAFILTHQGCLGCAPNLAISDIHLEPHHAFRSSDGLLTLLRFDQSYRGLPVFGADAVVTIIATKLGALGIRGAIVDAREEYDHFDSPSSQEQAEEGLLVRAAQFLAVPPQELTIHDLRLIAFPRLKKIGWVASVRRGLMTVGTAVIEADPAPVEGPPLLIYFHSDVGEGLADETPITVRADNPAENPTDGVLEPIDRTQLFDTSDIKGSTNGPVFVLGNERVFGVDGTDLTGVNDFFATPALSSPTDQFTSSPGTAAFRVQDTFAIVSDMYARTDKIMAGRWDSALEGASLFPPQEFKPRVAIWENAPLNTCEFFTSVDGVAFCAGGEINLIGNDPGPLANEYEQPLGGVVVNGEQVYEALSFVAFEKGSGVDAEVQTHEFGHVVDFFATSGLMNRGFGCQNCMPSCVVGTTNEVGSLMESWAQFASLWYFRELYAFGAMPSSCGILSAVSRGQNPSAHREECRPSGKQFPVFLRPDDPDCPQVPGEVTCDRPGPEDADPDTGLCRTSYGYDVDSFFLPLWELLHAETCAADPPYVCTPLPELGKEPIGDVVGRALLHALRVNTGTYQGFVDDMGVYISCNHGAQAFQEFNTVFCHHFLQSCGAPAPTPPCCGNGSREATEECDGDDFDGATCADLGFDGGVLSCNDDCEIDDSQCTQTSPTTGTGETDTTGPTGSGSSGADAASESLSGPGDGDGDGCACSTGEKRNIDMVWLLGALPVVLGRRTRRRLAFAVPFVCPVLISACGSKHSGSDVTGDTEAATAGTNSTTMNTTASTGNDQRPFRRFGVYHRENRMVSYQNPPDKFLLWQILVIRDDGTLDQLTNTCTTLTGSLHYTWAPAGDGAIRVVPDEVSPAGTFLWGADQVVGVTLSEGDGCDDLIEFIDYSDESGQMDYSARYVPGELCAQGTDCDFTFVWCDGVGPDPCE